MMDEVERIKWQNIHILGFMISSCALIWMVIGELIATTQNVWNIFAYICLIQCSIGGVMCIVGMVKGGCPF